MRHAGNTHPCALGGGLSLPADGLIRPPSNEPSEAAKVSASNRIRDVIVGAEGLSIVLFSGRTPMSGARSRSRGRSTGPSTARDGCRRGRKDAYSRRVPATGLAPRLRASDCPDRRVKGEDRESRPEGRSYVTTRWSRWAPRSRSSTRVAVQRRPAIRFCARRDHRTPE